jgi:glycosyltransferase involved in cell wall biosynthesis
MSNALADRTFPLVSVILPVRDRAAWVARAVTSALEQTYAAIEVIAIDDGSTDATRSVLDSFGDRIVVLSREKEDERGGAYAARNRGLQIARGEFIAFLDSDDRWFPDHLARLLPLLSRSEVGLVFGDALYVRVNGPPSARRTCFDITRPHRGRVAAALAWGNFVPTTTVIVRRRCLDEVGAFSLENASSDAAPPSPLQHEAIASCIMTRHTAWCAGWSTRRPKTRPFRPAGSQRTPV